MDKNHIHFERGFRVGLRSKDDPISDKLGPVTKAISAVERFVDSEGEYWEFGFWAGIHEQPNFERKLLATGLSI